jgi:preprotein translocase subunit YajC
LTSPPPSVRLSRPIFNDFREGFLSRVHNEPPKMIPLALLQGSDSTTALIANVLPILAIGLVFYFIVIAPANKQRKKTQEMLGSLKKGDRVLTTGGIYGTIQGVEAEVVYVKIAENVKVKVARSAVSAVVGGESE